MLVSVSSVSSRPIASVRSPDRDARSGTPNPAVQIVTKLGSRLPSESVTASAATAVTTDPGPSTISTPSLRSRLATDRRPGVLRYGPRTRTAHQRDGAALLGQLGGGLDSGRAGPDHTHRRAVVQLVEGEAQALGLLEIGDGISEFVRTGDCGTTRAAAHRVDQIVVGQWRAAEQLHVPGLGRRCGWPRRSPARCRGRGSRHSRRRRRRSRPPTGAGGSARRTPRGG